MQAVRTGCFGVLTALLSVGPAPAGPISAPVRHPAAAHTEANCGAGQLAVGGLGSSTAAGTVLLSVRVTDISVDQCTLSGYPRVTFIGSHGAALAVSAAHTGPGAVFGRPRPIVLVPSSGPTAVFVVASMDDVMPQQHCAAVRAVRTWLPGGAGSFVTDVPTLYELCRGSLSSPGSGPFPVDISSFNSDSVAARYAPAWPACQHDELTMAVGGEFAASGAAAYPVTLAARLVPGPLCTLDGYARAVLLDRAGAVVVRFQADYAAGTFPPVARPRPVTVGGQDRAQFIIEAADWQTAVNGGTGAPCPTSTALVVTLPGGGQLVAHGHFQLCLNGGVGAFTAAGV